MDPRPRLTISIEIDEIQTETFVVTTLNELYQAIDAFFATYHFTDPVAKLKIRDRIVTSYKNAQKTPPARPPLVPPEPTASAKENHKTPLPASKGARAYQPEFKATEFQAPPRLPEPSAKSASKPAWPVDLKHKSLIKPVRAAEAGLASKKSAALLRPHQPSTRYNSRTGPSSFNKTGKMTPSLMKGKTMSRIFPRLQNTQTVSTFTEIHGDTERRESDVPVARPQMTPNPTKSSVAVGAMEMGFLLNRESGSITGAGGFDDFVPASAGVARKQNPANCMTERPNKFPSFTPLPTTLATQLDGDRSSDEFTRSWAFPKSKHAVGRERTHASTSQFRLDQTELPGAHKPTNSDCFINDPDLELATFEMTNPSPYIYRRKTQVDSPVGLYVDRVSRSPYRPEARLSPKTSQSHPELLDRLRDDQGLKYFLKINYRSERLQRIFRSFDDKQLGGLTPSNLNLIGINSEVLRNFKPLITHVFEAVDRPPIDYAEFLRLVYAFQISF